MLGNVWEWTSSNFPGAQTMYVLRGASWIDTADGSANHRARVTTRSVMLYAYYSKSAFIRLLLVLLVTVPVDTKQVHQQLLKLLSKAIYENMMNKMCILCSHMQDGKHTRFSL